MEISNSEALKDVRRQYRAVRQGRIHADGAIVVAGDGGAVVIVARVIAWSGATESVLLVGKGMSKAISLSRMSDATVVPYCIALVDNERVAYEVADTVKGRLGCVWKGGGRGIDYSDHEVKVLADALMEACREV